MYKSFNCIQYLAIAAPAPFPRISKDFSLASIGANTLHLSEATDITSPWKERENVFFKKQPIFLCSLTKTHRNLSELIFKFDSQAFELMNTFVVRYPDC